MEENFLLNTPTAQYLYQEHAEKLPVIDYHNHLNVQKLSANRQYGNPAQLWVMNDPYKHRAMRICGVEENRITGQADAFEKFSAWMSVLPRLAGNPLYDWSVMEMKRVFGTELKPGITDAKLLWEEINAKLSKPEYSAFALLERFQVEYAAPCALITEDISSFRYFQKLAPSLRGDTIVNITKECIDSLGEMTQTNIETREDFFAALETRLTAFEEAGCRFSDHALDDDFVYYPDDGKNSGRFLELRQGKELQGEEKPRLASEILRFLAGQYAKKGWTMQLHIGARRYTSSRLRAMAGPAGGFAGIGSCCDIKNLTRMLDDFEKGRYGLPRTILFTLNPADNAAMSALSGSYSQDGVAGKIQQGPAWWWCDHLYGMREVFENISAFGVLSVFVGMTTDSRSILSFVRHEYFRRALCGWLGEKVHRGDLTADREVLGKMVEDICYYNAKRRL